MINSLSKTGLSLSQAQSISNLCNQRAREIENILTGINNATKEVKIGNELYQETVGKPMPKNVVDLLKEKAKLHAAQAFLMENIKAKDVWLKELKNKSFSSDLPAPVAPEYTRYKEQELVDETWGKEQLTISEICEWLDCEATAAHIGQFIHKNGTLDKLRTELPKIKTLEFIVIKDGEKTPVKVIAHHTSEELLGLHEELAGLHRDAESRLNYFKAKVKNLVTENNAMIARINALEQGQVNAKNQKLMKEYRDSLSVWQDAIEKQRHEFEEQRQKEISTVAALRINIDKRFKDVIDMFMDLSNTNL